MNNVMRVYNENNEEIEIELLFNFRVEEYKKEYVVYTINDDNISEKVAVYISELNREKNKLISISEYHKEAVKIFYEQAKNMILNQ